MIPILLQINNETAKIVYVSGSDLLMRAIDKNMGLLGVQMSSTYHVKKGNLILDITKTVMENGI